MLGSLPVYQQGVQGQALVPHMHRARLPNHCRRRCKNCRESLDVRTVAFFGKQASTSTAVAAQQTRTVSVDITKTSVTSRRLAATVYIDAPVEVVWGALTDYDNLHTFIPGLVMNKCLKRTTNGCVLLQESAQDVALGVKFSAACKLDIAEYPAGLPAYLCAEDGNHDYSTSFPCPKTSNRGFSQSDISFSLIEGDFAAFKGVWRMQAGADNESTLLNYALYVKPMPWLPVGLIQNRIEKEVVANLKAVRRHTEHLHRSSRESMTSSMNSSSSSSTLAADDESSSREEGSSEQENGIMQSY